MPISRDRIVSWIDAYADIVAENKDYLTELDSAIGDADHGINMNRGFKAVVLKKPEYADKDIGTIFKTIGMTLLNRRWCRWPALWNAVLAGRDGYCRKNGAHTGRMDGCSRCRRPGGRDAWKSGIRR